MSDAEQIASKLQDLLPYRAGSMRVFGDWFGAPMDNEHFIVAADVSSGDLVLKFNEDETLIVSDPQGHSLELNTFRIDKASKVHWEWFYYGFPHKPEHRYSIDHWLEKGEVRASSTAPPPHVLSPSSDQPAVEFVRWPSPRPSG
jgi:hypothetical protein